MPRLHGYWAAEVVRSWITNIFQLEFVSKNVVVLCIYLPLLVTLADSCMDGRIHFTLTTIPQDCELRRELRITLLPIGNLPSQAKDQNMAIFRFMWKRRSHSFDYFTSACSNARPLTETRCRKDRLFRNIFHMVAHTELASKCRQTTTAAVTS